MHQGNRRHAPHGLLQTLFRFVADHPAGLHPQQRGNGLKVVLDPVVDFPDGGVLGDKLHLPAPQLGHVAAQDERPEPLLLVAEGNRPQGQAYAPGFDLTAPRHASGDNQRQRFIDHAAVLEQAGSDFGKGPPLQ
jgi:hypothetical protein